MFNFRLNTLYSLSRFNHDKNYKKIAAFHTLMLRNSAIKKSHLVLRADPSFESQNTGKDQNTDQFKTNNARNYHLHLSAYAIGLGAIGLFSLYSLVDNWRYAYPIEKGPKESIPAYIQETPAQTKLLHTLQEKRPENENRVIVLSGPSGTGKSMLANLILRPDYLAQWLRPESLLNYGQLFLSQKPWLTIIYKGTIEDRENKQFEKTFYEYLEEVEREWNTHIKKETWWDVLKGISRPAEMLPTLIKLSSTFISPWYVTEAEKQNRQDALKKYRNHLEINPGWVIIIDNVQTLTNISPWLPEKGGTLIFTTNSGDHLGFT